ncbi:D-alanine--D-alanine ligase [Streptomyces caniscabiei]|uniref:D-alanine--D-alanine ligase family protein n=1 Tax=Streptomyces caniscabiei TaxID=2746961 RepID=UPI0029B96EB0|nr:D-alanine--D-alanine ligase family protein [Streptomyces caniscabiei]MDX2776052.1 D-alanine--D-alanine ligase [Streptomyces caniscabiei]
MNTTHKKTVLLLFGGESSEHDVSILSAQNVAAAIDTRSVTLFLCYIDPKGNWWHAETVEKTTGPADRISPVLGSSQVAIGGRIVPIDVIFPVLHGKNGEDGTVQGLAALLHVPVVGCDMDGSLLCMDKGIAKQLLANAGIAVVPGRAYAADTPPPFAALAREFGQTLFIKPARQGSSVGVSKVKTEAEYEAAFQEAGTFDNTVIVETAIKNARELEVAILGGPRHAQASPAGEVIPDREFYDYASKYSSASTSRIVIPAALSDGLHAQIQRDALLAYQTLHCRGLARVDFFLTTDGTLYLNEINTMPGFTNISMYPKLWESVGMDNQTLVMTLIDQAS